MCAAGKTVDLSIFYQVGGNEVRFRKIVDLCRSIIPNFFFNWIWRVVLSDAVCRDAQPLFELVEKFNFIDQPQMTERELSIWSARSLPYRPK